MCYAILLHSPLYDTPPGNQRRNIFASAGCHLATARHSVGNVSAAVSVVLANALTPVLARSRAIVTNPETVADKLLSIGSALLISNIWELCADALERTL